MTISNRAAGLILVALLLFGGWVYLVRPDYKYRLTLTVETPNGIKAASNVFSGHQSKEPSFLPGTASFGVKGDAVFLDLGGGRNLVAILAHGDDGRYVDGMSFLPLNLLSSRGHKTSFGGVSTFAGQTFPVIGRNVPALISFSDLADPKTARLVQWNNLEATFGKGYYLWVSLTIIPVGLWPFDIGGPFGEPVTRSITKLLPWWNQEGRPAVVALKAAGLATASSIDAEYAFDWK
jgi:hypothetical protein